MKFTPPQKSNIDTKKHILKESTLSKPSFWVSMLGFFVDLNFDFIVLGLRSHFCFRILCHDDHDDINCPKKDACCWFLLA